MPVLHSVNQFESSPAFAEDSPATAENYATLTEGLPPREVHRRALAARKALGKVQSALSFWLLKVERRRIFELFGCSSVFSCAEQYLDLSPHTIAEHLRTGKELQHLPKLAEACARGEVAATKVREISRVATPETESAWLNVAAGSTCRRVEKLVAMTPKGGLPPTRTIDPSASKKQDEKIPEVILGRESLTCASLTQDTAAAQVLPSNLSALSACEGEQGENVATMAGGVGPLHHIIPLSKGWEDKGSILVALCSACHDLVHRGLLTVEGTAPDGLVWKNRRGEVLKG